MKWMHCRLAVGIAVVAAAAVALTACTNTAPESDTGSAGDGAKKSKPILKPNDAGSLPPPAPTGRPGVGMGETVKDGSVNAGMMPAAETQEMAKPMKVTKSESEWRTKLNAEQYRVLREKGTERAFSGKYWNTKTPGEYRCAGCNTLIFKSDAKFDSGCGWPSFNKPVASNLIEEHRDTSFGMERVEVTCATCGGHLGHVFEDAPDQPTGLRYCINSVSIEHVPDEKKTEEKK